MSDGPVKIALITGGFRRIGAAIAARLARDGWVLALHGAHSLVPEDALAAALSQTKARWHGFHADLAQADAVLALLPAIAAHFGRLPQLIINNASLFADDDAGSLTAAALASHYAVNVAAPVLLATELAKQLPPSDPGCVINILDQRIAQPHGDQLSYTLSKQALSGATQTLARALSPRIRVNAVAPGLTMATPDYTETQWKKLGTMMPLASLPTPAQIADAVAWLAQADAVTGQTIFVDGGAHMISFDRDFVHLARD